jgi:glutaredoxin|tara:strand:- start:114 stop:422 length:309 start_codon:yes stop_codon:yes gene_type:complete
MYKELTDLTLPTVGDYAAVLVKSDTCPDCEYAERFFPANNDEVELYVVDFDIEEELCDSWEVYSVPCVIFLNKGNKQGAMWGLQEPTTNKGFIEAHLKRAKK